MSRYSSANTLGPLSIALPEPSKIRPNMSSDTPSFKLSPVNSTLVCCSWSVSCSLVPCGYLPHLLHIDAGSTLEDLFMMSAYCSRVCQLVSR